MNTNIVLANQTRELEISNELLLASERGYEMNKLQAMLKHREDALAENERRQQITEKAFFDQVEGLEQ